MLHFITKLFLALFIFIAKKIYSSNSEVFYETNTFGLTLHRSERIKYIQIVELN